MRKEEAIQVIDHAKEGVINPVELLHYVWLRTIVRKIDDAAWEKAVAAATEELAR